MSAVEESPQDISYDRDREMVHIIMRNEYMAGSRTALCGTYKPWQNDAGHGREPNCVVCIDLYGEARRLDNAGPLK